MPPSIDLNPQPSMRDLLAWFWAIGAARTCTIHEAYILARTISHMRKRPSTAIRNNAGIASLRHFIHWTGFLDSSLALLANLATEPYAASFNAGAAALASDGGCNDATEVAPSSIVTLAITNASIPNNVNAVMMMPHASMMLSFGYMISSVPTPCVR
jgi:hypothetical protein